jgi:hypothetical protein
MGAMGPREFEQYQARMARELENLKTFVELTAAPPDEDEATALPADVRLEIRVGMLRDSVRERIDSLWNLDDDIRYRWARTIEDIDVFGPGAAEELGGRDGLADRVNAYADGFPYHLGTSNYAAATTLHEDLRSLASTITELATLCSRYQARD